MSKINIKSLLDKRLDRIALITEATARKIIKKELNKFKKDVIKSMLKENDIHKS